MTPGEARFDSASAATLVPTMDFHVTQPRTGYMIEAAEHGGGRGLVGARLDVHAESPM